MTTLGLTLIIVGWGIQFFSRGNEVKVAFVLIYALGVALLFIDGFSNSAYTLAFLNLISFLSALAVYLKIRK